MRNVGSQSGLCGVLGLAVLGAALFLINTVSCSERAGGARAPGPLRVVVSVPPLAGLVRPLLPQGAELRVMIPPGQSEHGYEMTAGDAQALASADLVVLVGLGLDRQVAEYLKGRGSPFRKELVFAEAAGVAAGAETNPEHDEEHEHGETAGGDDGHDHGGLDPHVWLDPKLVENAVPRLAAGVREASGRVTPGSASANGAAEEKLLAEVRAVDEEYRGRLAPFAGRAIVTHHAAWKRLADRYGLRVAAVIRPIESSEPTAGAVTDAVRAIEREHVTAIFVERQFSAQAAERIAALAKVKVATLDPLGDGDWFKMMRENLDSLVKNLAP